jgi:poly(3-hydroxybutyrate) depolymerase
MKITGMLALLLGITPVIAQDTIRFEKVLAVQSGSRYGREAVYTDLLSYGLFSNQLQPAEGRLFHRSAAGDSVVWSAVTADENGRFRVFGRRNFQRSNNPFLNPGAVDRGADYLYITYTAPRATVALLRVQGSAGLYINGAPHMGDPYSAGYMHIPVLLKKGLNEMYIRGANVLPELIPLQQPLHLHTDDVTAPHIIISPENSRVKVALVVSNAGTRAATGLSVVSTLLGKSQTSAIPAIPAMATRKIIFEVDASAVSQKGKYPCNLVLKNGSATIHTAGIVLEAVLPSEQYSNTFISPVDGSLQYYAVTPQLGGSKEQEALFLSVHGAGVEAIGQARAYKSKSWGTLVAATNRRPRGFNWEDWGRLDALEVLQMAQEKFKPDPSRIYLTGHSMGGHGTWFLGATYPGNWAAIGPAAGYASLKDYGSADGRIPDSARTEVERFLLRSGNQSDVPRLATNYQALGIYILHGDSDRVVPVTYARQMRELLGGFHKDFSYYEYPGGEHWFGDQSVDWPPLFDYFKWHQRQPDSTTHVIDFTTSSPGISANLRWATIYQQIHPLQYSRVQLRRNRAAAAITGNTQNVALLKLALADFTTGTTLQIVLDSTPALSYRVRAAGDSLFLQRTKSGWALATAPPAADKNPLRYGTFKEAFNHHMVFVVGTGGTAAENEVNRNKAIYDAESWYYRGNGAVDIINDADYTAARYSGRNIILYGNADNNSAWKLLLHESPIQVKRNTITVGNKSVAGDNLAAYFIWPQKNPALLVGVIAATGLKGMQAAYANQYFAGGSGFPDFMVFSDQMLKDGAAGVKLAGFFNNSWRLTSEEMAGNME